jgi:hypothetical protein
MKLLREIARVGGGDYLRLCSAKDDDAPAAGRGAGGASSQQPLRQVLGGGVV